MLAFVARLNGQVGLCDLDVVCSCKKSMSFVEKFKTLELIHGLYDKEIQEKVLAAGAALDVMTTDLFNPKVFQMESMLNCKIFIFQWLTN